MSMGKEMENSAKSRNYAEENETKIAHKSKVGNVENGSI